MGLIELMIGVALAALLLTLALPSFQTGAQNRQIRNAADAIQNGLQIARTEALRRNRDVQFKLQTTTGSAWTVGCVTPDDTVDSSTGEVKCPTTIQTRESQGSSSNASVATSQLTSAGSAVSTTTFTDTVGFTPLGRTTDATLPAGTMALFDVSNPAGGTCAAAGGEMRCLRVVVTNFGQVRMCDPAVTASTDPRKC